jgi:DNA replication initiation complex subunit (GINS family)
MYTELYAAWRREVEEPSLGSLSPDFYTRLAEYLKHISQENILDKKSVKVSLLELEAQNVLRMLNELLLARYKKIVDTLSQSQKVPPGFLTIEEVRMSEDFIAFASSYQEFTNDLMQGNSIRIEAKMEVKTEPKSKTIIEAKVDVKTVAQASAEAKAPSQVANKRAVLRFTKASPGIIGADMKTYGPFAAEDVASVSAKNAEMLVKQGLAVLIEVS